MTDLESVWSADDYAAVATQYLPLAARLVEAAGVDAGDAVLDVGCGTGSVAVTAARRGADATGVDVSASMLRHARENAATAGVEAAFRRGDATALPVDDDAFDATLSSLGHMYGDPPDAAARELRRVTRPGGRVSFTAWTPGSLYPALAAVVTTYLAPEDRPEFAAPPFAWGDDSVVRDRLETGFADVAFETGVVGYPALSPAHFWREQAANSSVFREFLGRVDDADRPELREELVRTVEPYFDDARNEVELEYLLTTATVES